MPKKKVLLALSGGVDSSVAALFLQEQGFEVIAATMDTGFGKAGEEAAAVAEQLGIKHHIIDVREQFYKFVIADFVKCYNIGKTPNPCVRCNPLVKFAFMQSLSEKLKTDYIATGHYAQIDAYNDRFAVKKAAYLPKDQSYVLYRLSQAMLAKLILPLGSFSKEEIRGFAAKKGLLACDKPDSQDICFIPDADYRVFLQQQGAEFKQGNFVDKEGKILGIHQGLPCYTIGQRKKLGIALGYQVFVCALDKEKNEVILGREDDMVCERSVVTELAFQGLERISEPLQISVKLRYKSPPVPAKLLPFDENKAELHFITPQKAITPGQSAVFYDQDIVLGGGIIENNFLFK